LRDRDGFAVPIATQEQTGGRGLNKLSGWTN
jgi:hypothetical protein